MVDFFRHKQQGYSLIEMLVVIVVIGILASIAMSRLTNVADLSRLEATRVELDQLAHAFAGDPDLVTAGCRLDFGYVGDVGSMPSGLADLVTRPGGYTTWDGPYIFDDFYSASGGNETEYLNDEWGSSYVYSGTTIRSTGGGSNLTRTIGNSTDDLIHNDVAILVLNSGQYPPGAVYRDSVSVTIFYPRTGVMTSRTAIPRPDGLAEIDSIPIGLHLVEVVYMPDVDTNRYKITVTPGTLSYLEVQLNGASW